jgi:hypothetical protein
MDVGGTYRNVLQSLNGEDFDNTYFEYDPRPIEFNPFIVPLGRFGQVAQRRETSFLALFLRSGRATGIPASISPDGPFWPLPD